MEEPGEYNAGAPQTETATAEQSPPQPKPQFKCPTCDREFGNAIGLQTHVTRAHRKFWSTSQPKQRKYKTKHARLNLDLTCPLCGNEFRTKATLGAHIRKVHNRSATEFPGFRGTAARKFQGGKLRLSATAALRLPRTKKDVECPICHNTYANRNSLRTHIRAFHHRSPSDLVPGRKSIGRSPDKLSKTCPVCRKRYSTRSIMGFHLRRIHGRSLTSFENETATAFFNGAAPKTYAGAKHKRGALECPVCRKILSKAYLPGHMKLIHGKTIGQFNREQRGEAPAPAPVEKPAIQVEHARHVKFCPVCGTNIISVQTAVNFGD